MNTFANLRRGAHRAALCALGMAALGSVGCSHKQLDPSFGLRNREMFRVQTSARNSRDAIAHGQEVESAVGTYYQSIAPGDNGPKQAASSSGGGIKIPALH
jgi:hypothetical protein